MRTLFFFLFIILPEICICETTTARLQGADKASVINLLGQPNRTSSVPSGANSYSSETLYYGDSQVSLINNKVSSIFDLGEIKNLLLKNNGKLEESSNWTIWPNPWTPPRSILTEISTLKLEMENQTSSDYIKDN